MLLGLACDAQEELDSQTLLARRGASFARTQKHYYVDPPRIERGECPQAANLFYKVIDARSGQRSTALATNIDFEAWSDYLGDPPLAMAFLDRIVDGAILLKIRGKSYRAHRAKKSPTASKSDAA